MYNAFISYSHAADGKLAPKLQIALEKFAKPWYKLRNLNIFRDEASLSASPHLWSNIQNALDKSEYLIYMASPRSADSKWVKLEIEHWLQNHPLENLIIVLTEGDIPWDYDKGRFKNVDQNALPENLEKRFREEPFYIDLRTAKNLEDISLKNPIFNKEVLKLAAHLHGVAPKDMAGEEVRQHKKMIRIRNAATLTLIALLGTSIYQTKEARNQTYIANQKTIEAQKSDSIAQYQRGVAEYQKQVAEDSSRVAQEQRKIARDSSRVAKEQRDIAVFQTKIAQQQTRIAKANLYISEAQRVENPTIAVLYAKEAVKLNPSPEIKTIANTLYKNSNFSKSVVISQNLYLQDSITFLPNGNEFITYGDVDSNYEWYNMDFKFDELTDERPTGKAYRVWSLKGELLDELNRNQLIAKYGNPFINKNENNDIGFYADALSIRIFDKKDFTILNEIDYEAIANKVTSLQFSPNFKKIIGICNDGIIRVWDIETNYLMEYNTHKEYALISRWHPEINEESIMHIAVSDNSQKMIVSIPGEFQLWDLNYKSIINSITINDDINYIKFSNNSNEVLIKSNGANFNWNIYENIYKPYNSEIKIESSNKFLNYREAYNTTGFSIGHTSGAVVYSENRNGKKQCLMAIGFEQIDYLSISENNKYIFVATSDTLRLYPNRVSIKPIPETDCSNNVPIKKFINSFHHIITDVAFSPDGKFMLTMGNYEDFESDKITKNICVLWDLDTEDFVMKFPQINSEHNEEEDFDSIGYNRHISFSSDSKKILINVDNKVSIWNCPYNLQDFMTSDYLNNLELEKRSRVNTRIWD
jgi:WD40 repeat protein